MNCEADDHQLLDDFGLARYSHGVLQKVRPARVSLLTATLKKLRLSLLSDARHSVLLLVVDIIGKIVASLRVP